MKNRSRFTRLAALAAGVVLAGVIALMGGGRSQGAPADHPAEVPMVLQGQVTDLGTNSITIRTPDIRPRQEPGKMTPMFIIAGKIFKADTGHAEFQTPMGSPSASGDIKTGDWVVIVCRPVAMVGGLAQPAPVTALVVERLQIPRAP